MADRQPGLRRPGGAAAVFERLRQPPQLFPDSRVPHAGGVRGILLLLTGLTLTAAVVGLIFFSPLLLLSSPLWVPVAALTFTAAALLLLTCGSGVATLAAASWAYKIDFARSRIADTAGHVKEYAREHYGGYLRGRVKDAAPGA
ncbi:unnamed protein product [Spirodela intermedia]|uniref:Uncharacterized protein n=1 Tax=Spirodela intermedia TaxID=51605 RepID=A0A7I8JSM3_SPIIN|nr:unnamed protein product [Spirodela intermedia]CAA6673119.1 unnamed protein product [Spirodela intermedia]